MTGEQLAPAAASSQSSVGVLGWLGFIIINWAAWGIVSVGSFIGWFLGFAFCIVYTGLLVGLALWLEKRDKAKFRQFLNLLWVLVASFVFVLGMYLAINVVAEVFNERPGSGGGSGGGFGGGGSAPDYSKNTRASLLPENASADLMTWEDTQEWTATENYRAFNDRLYFNADAEGSDHNEKQALSWWKADASINRVSPLLRNAGSFAEFDSKLFVIANSETADGSQSIQIWRIDPGSPSSAALAIAQADLRPEGVEDHYDVRIEHLFVDADSNTLYFKGSYYCNSCKQSVYSLYSSDGTASGTMDLRGDVCTPDCGGAFTTDTATTTSNNNDNSSDSGDSPYTGSDDGKPVATLWSALIVAVLPMMLLAGFILKVKQLPGPFVNLYAGFEGAVVLLYLILAPAGQDFFDGLLPFMKWFLTIYNTLFWVAIAVWSLRNPKPDEWKDELKSWAVAIVGVSFFLIIHIDLEVPYKDDAWRWVLYFLITLVQLVLSAIVSRTVPMVTGAIGLFVLSWKIAYEIVTFADFGADGPFNEFSFLSLMAIMAVEGTGIVLGAIWYASQRERIDDMVQAALRCDCARVRELGKELTPEITPKVEVPEAP